MNVSFKATVNCGGGGGGGGGSSSNDTVSDNCLSLVQDLTDCSTIVVSIAITVYRYSTLQE